MTNEERYNALLMELAQLITEKNNSLALLEWQLENLKQQLAEAEALIEEMKGAGEDGSD